MSAPGARILHVAEAMDRGGAESLIVEHVRHAGPGVETHVCALNRGGAALEAARAAGARVHVLAKGRGVGGAAGIPRLAALMRRERITVVNGHNPTGGLYAVLAARLAGVRAVVRTEHSLHYPGRHSALYPMLEPVLTSLAGRVVCVCEAVRASHATRMPRLADRFVTVLNGISDGRPADRGAARAALGLAADMRAVLTVGSLTKQKAQPVLLGGFAIVARADPRAVLLVAGAGARAEELRTRAAALGIAERVRWLGARDDVDALLAACDVFALSSEREGLPVTLLEAMRAGRAVVSTRAGGCGEAVVDGVTGRLVAVGDGAALGDALRATLADPGAAAAQGAAGRARWGERFTAERMVRETEALCLALLERAPSGPEAPA